MSLLENINSPKDIKNFNINQLAELADEIRKLILHSVHQNGGHLSSNLGVVELTIAIHYIFDIPKDKLIFDVGHQCYTHKILTGRKELFLNLRKSNGISGFPKRDESQFDVANTGHASTALAIACGLSRAKTEGEIVTVLGDGAMTGGLVYEALNDLSTIKSKQIIILNDNDMSISKNVGYVSKYLSKLHKTCNCGAKPFAEYGLEYFGTVDGHDFEKLFEALNFAKKSENSVLIHVLTKKGKGDANCEKDPVGSHGYSPESSSKTSFSTAFGDKLCEMAKKNDKIFAITAAMADGTGLENFAETFPERFVDTGITEGYAITMASGLALGGKKPYFAVYSSFLQRAFDNLLHDVCLSDLPITVCVDRAGLVGGDGETHQGIYDVCFLNCMPNMTIACPKDNEELEKMLEFSENFEHPLVVRYPKGSVAVEYNHCDNIQLGKVETLIDEKSEITILALGATMCEQAVICHQLLEDKNVKINVVNARFALPLDENFLRAQEGKTLITLEDNVENACFGSSVCKFLNNNNIKANIIIKALSMKIETQATVAELLKRHAVDAQSIADCILGLKK